MQYIKKIISLNHNTSDKWQAAFLHARRHFTGMLAGLNATLGLDKLTCESKRNSQGCEIYTVNLREFKSHSPLTAGPGLLKNLFSSREITYRKDLKIDIVIQNNRILGLYTDTHAWSIIDYYLDEAVFRHSPHSKEFKDALAQFEKRSTTFEKIADPYKDKRTTPALPKVSPTILLVEPKTDGRMISVSVNQALKFLKKHPHTQLLAMPLFPGVYNPAHHNKSFPESGILSGDDSGVLDEVTKAVREHATENRDLHVFEPACGCGWLSLMTTEFVPEIKSVTFSDVYDLATLNAECLARITNMRREDSGRPALGISRAHALATELPKPTNFIISNSPAYVDPVDALKPSQATVASEYHDNNEPGQTYWRWFLGLAAHAKTDFSFCTWNLTSPYPHSTHFTEEVMKKTSTITGLTSVQLHPETRRKDRDIPVIYKGRVQAKHDNSVEAEVCRALFNPHTTTQNAINDAKNLLTRLISNTISSLHTSHGHLNKTVDGFLSHTDESLKMSERTFYSIKKKLDQLRIFFSFFKAESVINEIQETLDKLQREFEDQLIFFLSLYGTHSYFEASPSQQRRVSPPKA